MMMVRHLPSTLLLIMKVYFTDARVGFNPTTYSTAEGGAVSIIVQLFDMLATTVTVSFRTVDGPATFMFVGDYTAEQRTITIEPTGTVAFIPVQIQTDERD